MVKKTLRRKKMNKKNNNLKHINKTKRQGRGVNYNIQKLLIKLCYKNKWNNYDTLVQAYYN